MSKLGNTAGGAASGAATGAAFGPWGMAAGGVIGGLMGYFGGDDGDAVADAQAQKLAAGREAAADYLAYRDTANQARMNALAGQESYFDMNSSIMNSMNGGQGAPDIAGGVYKSPIQADGMKEVSVANSTPNYQGAPMPTQNAPEQVSYFRRPQ